MNEKQDKKSKEMSMNNIKQINPINEEEVKALKRIRGGGKQNKK